MNRLVLLGVLVVVGCAEPEPGRIPPVTNATRTAALEFAKTNPFVFKASVFIDPETFRDVPNYTLHVVHPGDRPHDVHVFYKEGTDTTEVLARVDTETIAKGCGTWGCTGRVFTHPTKFSQHEHRAVVDWISSSPLRPWLNSAIFNWSEPPATLSFDIEVWPGAIEPMREMLQEGGVPEGAVTILLAHPYEAH